MPIILCQFCEYVGQGDDTSYDDDDILVTWADVEGHERTEHPEELAELSELEAHPE